MQAIMTLGCRVYGFLNKLGEWVPLLGLRVILAYEFWEAGVEKFNGENWFVDFRGEFPFPFNILPADISWFLSTWTELAGSIAILVGFATRFSAASLIILDLVAWYSVHAENGYNVCSNGFKLPLLYLLMLIPLLLSGPGKASIDHFISKSFGYSKS
jgi:putative oxidoreductase